MMSIPRRRRISNGGVEHPDEFRWPSSRRVASQTPTPRQNGARHRGGRRPPSPRLFDDTLFVPLETTTRAKARLLMKEENRRRHGGKKRHPFCAKEVF